MRIQRLSVRDVTALRNPGKLSEQLVWPHNAPESSLTITRVTLEPGATSEPHQHARSEQIWIVERGSGQIWLEDGAAELKKGDIIRTPAGVTHGIRNTGDEPLVYLSVTTPPEDFTMFYRDKSPA